MSDQPVVATTLPPFSGDRPTCPKCGWHEARTTWMPEQRLCSCRTATGIGERMCRECLRCWYHWDEATATTDDAAPFRRSVPLGQQFSVDLVHVGENCPGETRVRIVHTPSGLHHVLTCVSLPSAKAAELPIRMFQALLDDVDAWGRKPLSGSCSPAAEVSISNSEPEPVDCARCGEPDHCACWHDACCTCGSKDHAACGTHPDASGCVAHGRNCATCCAVAAAYASKE